jgi:hypothetical protein
MSKGHIVEVVSSPQVSGPGYFFAFAVGMLGNFTTIDSWIKLAALVGSILLIAANTLTIRNKWLEGRKLKLEIRNAQGES